MKPKNSKERTNSILKFALLFLFVTALIVTTFFFDFNRVPLKENEILRERLSSIQREVEIQEKFSDEMQGVKKLFDSLDNSEEKYQNLINSSLTSKIGALDLSIPKTDSTYRYKMYKNIIGSYNEMYQLKKELKKFDNIDDDIRKYIEKIDRLESDLEKTTRELDAYRRYNN